MSEMFHTVERAAERLDVHPKTVLRFIHDGRLRATRIGKAWRILASDLTAFAGGKPAPPLPAQPAPAEPARVTAIADLPGVSMELSRRLAAALQASVMAPEGCERPIHLETAYDPARSHLKVIIVADALDAAALLKTLHALAEAFR